MGRIWSQNDLVLDLGCGEILKLTFIKNYRAIYKPNPWVIDQSTTHRVGVSSGYTFEFLKLASEPQSMKTLLQLIVRSMGHKLPCNSMPYFEKFHPSRIQP